MIPSSESIENISAALVAAQKSMSAAKMGAANQFYKSKYADLTSVIEACKDALNDNGISILQPHTVADGQYFVVTRLQHTSGEYMESFTPVITAKQNDPQALGSAISYARRYGLQSFVSIPGCDDDGEGAMVRDKPAKKEPVKKREWKASGAKAPSVKTPAKEVKSPPVASSAGASKLKRLKKKS